MGRSNDKSVKNRKDDSSSDEDSDFEEMNEKYGNKPLNKKVFRELVEHMFSSKLNSQIDNHYDKSDKKKSKKKKIRKKSVNPKKKKKSNRKKRKDDDSDSDSDDEHVVDMQHLNYVLSIQPVNPDEFDEEDYDEDEDEDYDEDEESSDDSESDEESDEESGEESDEESGEESDEESGEESSEVESDEESGEESGEESDPDEESDTKKNKKSKKDRKCKNKKSDTIEQVSKDLEAEIEKDEITLKELKVLYNTNKSDIYGEAYKAARKKLNEKKKNKDKKEKKVKQKNHASFREQLRNKNKLNDVSYFEGLTLKEQNKILTEVKKLNSLVEIEKPYRISLLESDIPPEFKAAAIKKINTLKMMEPGGGEYYKIKNWIDTFMSIPFGKYKNLEVSVDDGVDKCHEFMENAKNTLDTAVYGLNDAKMQIMQLMGQFITNPSAIGSAIAIQGPMGTGKTTMVKEGISKILGRDFSFIALGGATDSSSLEGHSYTYEGSTWGQIVNILIKSRSMNPVIYFDELDKVSDTPKGEEIIGILTHLTDTSQNAQFHDKYFSEIDFDLSKCLFIFSYNDITKINPILRDRMYNIQTKGYDSKEKIIISRNHILPKIREQVKFSEDDIIFDDEVIQYIIETHTKKEEGLRNLKRCYEIIYTKLNLYRLMKPGTNLFEEDMSITVEFPFTVTKDIVDKLIKKKSNNLTGLNMMYC